MGKRWWYYMVFPFLALFRMATLIIRLVYHYIHTNEIPFWREIVKIISIIIIQFFDWIKWWMTLCLLWLSGVIGRYVQPWYESILIYFDTTATVQRINKKSKRIQKDKKFRLLTLPRALCVLTEIHNVQAQDMVMIARMQYKYKGSMPYKCINFWNLV